MNIKLTFLLVVTLLFLIIPGDTYAHVLKSSASIGAVMHIQPDDDPIAGEESSFFFEFKDTSNKFDSSQCDCTFAIVQNGSEIYSQPLFQSYDSSLTNASVYYTFPAKGVYTIRVVGNPLTVGNFEPFTLEYDIRVERITAAQPAESTNWFTEHLSIIIGGVLGISALAFVLFVSRKQKHA